MDKDLDELQQLWRDNPTPRPDLDTKKRIISNALDEFEQKNAEARQGLPTLRRLMNKLRNFYAAIIGENIMTHARYLVGVLCLMLIAVSFLWNPYVMRHVPLPGLASAPPEMLASSPPSGTGRNDSASIDQLAPPVSPPAMVASAAPETKAESGQPQIGGNSGGLAVPAAPSTAPAKIRTAEMAASQRIGIAQDISEPYYQDQGHDKFGDLKINGVKMTASDPVSTFSIDVDTASYSFVRAALNNNVMPQKNAVRVEEMINYFPYDYKAPSSKSEPFKAHVAVYPNPWNAKTKLMHIGIKGYELNSDEKPKSNLVFLIDTSGSMDDPNKLPLLINSMKMLVGTLKPDDSIAIVTYAGSAGTVLPPTKASDKAKIMAALDNLDAGGSTAGAEGIRQAYQLAKSNFDKNGVNRVILATDGDFNVGINNTNELKSYIERERQSGVSLSVLGFGRGNYNDELMQALAQNGNGNAAYIDTINEARKALVNEAGSTLFTIAKDVKIQVEFNPATVSEYRLIGYETRLLNREDFNNDKVDAGEIGSGHSVTAIYEITPAGSNADRIDPLRYGNEAEVDKAQIASRMGDEYAFVKIRYKLPNEDGSKLITTPVDKNLEFSSIDQVPADVRFSTAVAAFGQKLHGDQYVGDFEYDDIATLAEKSKGTDKFGYRAEFINLIQMAKNAANLEVLKK
ncbi:MAG: VWA domain-containing protein [Alphaproteobacteria bacterium]|nr:MAG: VWA domain-containing protein [Alphaproteobacteria bacterium]